MIIEKGIYYAKDELYELFLELGGDCGNPGHRPIVCLVKSIENLSLYWAIPMGTLGHRSQNAIDRINKFIALPDNDIRSCFYHIGRTTNRSIFFISDVFPITDAYIDEEHLGLDKKHYIIKNSSLISELERKLFRILAYENANANYFGQHITDIKNHLISELTVAR